MIPAFFPDSAESRIVILPKKESIDNLTFIKYNKPTYKRKGAIRNGEKTHTGHSLLGTCLGSRPCGAAVLEHRKPMVQYLRIRQNRQGPHHHFLDGRHFGHRHHHCNLPVRNAVRPEGQAEKFHRYRIHSLGHLHDPVRHDGMDHRRPACEFRAGSDACGDGCCLCRRADVLLRLHGQ